MTYNTPVRHLQSGSVLEVASSGSVLIASGGSVQVASGGIINIAAGGSIRNAGGQSATNLSITNLTATDGTFAGTISIGGTVGRWAFGSTALTSGTALVYTGLTTIVDAGASALTVGNNGTGAGTATSFQVDPSRFANGTAYFFGLSGTSAFTGAGTITWRAFGY